MKVTELCSSRKRLTIADIDFNGGEVIIVNGKGYLYIFEEDVGLNFNEFTYNKYTAFAELETGGLVALPDNSPCLLVQNAELVYNRTDLKEWTD